MNKLLLCLTAAVLLFSIAVICLWLCSEKSPVFLYYQKACNMNYGEGCYKLGNFYYTGEGVNKDYWRALAYYEQACKMNNADGCGTLGVEYEGQFLRREGVKRDYQKAVSYYKKACHALNSGTWCNALGIFYESQKDYLGAKIYWDMACNLNDGRGCFNLGDLYRKGQGVSQNFQTAKQYFIKACDLGEPFGCDVYKQLNGMGY